MKLEGPGEGLSSPKNVLLLGRASPLPDLSQERFCNFITLAFSSCRKNT